MVCNDLSEAWAIKYVLFWPFLRALTVASGEFSYLDHTSLWFGEPAFFSLSSSEGSTVFTTSKSKCSEEGIDCLPVSEGNSSSFPVTWKEDCHDRWETVGWSRREGGGLVAKSGPPAGVWFVERLLWFFWGSFGSWILVGESGVTTFWKTRVFPTNFPGWYPNSLSYPPVVCSAHLQTPFPSCMPTAGVPSNHI